ncbi:hypothetical protein [Leptospira interrogans]|uniref:hypothetical protein n=2 Tax=Leptospira interrogans TaxID=173 RepID=UPI00215E7A43|nr:hypothetical protein [Leptospira interrogans]
MCQSRIIFADTSLFVQGRKYTKDLYIIKISGTGAGKMESKRQSFRTEIIEILWALKRLSFYETKDPEILIYESAIAIEHLSIITFSERSLE